MKNLLIALSVALSLSSCTVVRNNFYGDVDTYNLNTAKQDRNKALQNAYLQSSINQETLFTFSYADDNGDYQVATITEKQRAALCTRFALGVIFNK